MSESVFSRRVFLKGSAVAATALALVACGESDLPSCFIACGKNLGDLEVDFSGPYNSFLSPSGNYYLTEFRFIITPPAGNIVNLTADNFKFQINNQPAKLAVNDRLSKTEWSYLFDEMPILPNSSSVAGYLLVQSQKTVQHFNVTIQYNNAEVSFP